MGKNIQNIINEIESGAIKECTQTYMEGVIVVDSIEDFMRKNNAIRLEDLEHSNKKGNDIQVVPVNYFILIFQLCQISSGLSPCFKSQYSLHRFTDYSFQFRFIQFNCSFHISIIVILFIFCSNR